jgi:hypothetical protein
MILTTCEKCGFKAPQYCFKKSTAYRYQYAIGYRYFSTGHGFGLCHKCKKGV